MKKLFLLLTLLGTVTFTACDFEDDEPFYDEIPYTGTLSVIPLSGGDSYTWDNTCFGMLAEDNGTLTLWMYDTRFVPGMPQLTMAIPDITYASSASIISMLGDNIVPYMGGTPYQQYRITSLSGTLSNRQLNISFNCMGFRVTFIGYEHD